LVLAIAKALEIPVQEFVCQGAAPPGEASKRPPGRPPKAKGEPAPAEAPKKPGAGRKPQRSSNRRNRP
jgi:hypothetical protein